MTGALLIREDVYRGDVSLRRHGYGEQIDYWLPAVLRQIRVAFDERLERELLAATSQITTAVQSVVER
jgi:hypothetical protein